MSEAAGEGTGKDGLNARQLAAVRHAWSPQIVLAGPGTGKTRVITHRVADLIQRRGVKPESIVAVTFTVKAAEELRERLTGLVGAAAMSVNTHTFHSLGLTILRRFADEAGLASRPRTGTQGRSGRGAGMIADSSQQRRLLREIIVERRLFPTARGLGVESAVEHVEGVMEELANHGISPARAIECVKRDIASIGGDDDDEVAAAARRERLSRFEVAARAIEAFHSACWERGWLSLSDLITRPIELLKQSMHARAILHDDWRHWVVDEFQDVNQAQIEMLRVLAPPRADTDLTIVGDDDQSIYAFRGADERAMARFQSIWTGASVHTLEDNYRSTRSIVRVTQSVITRATYRFAPDKSATSRADLANAPVELVHLGTDFDDADVICAMILTDMKRRDGASLSDYAVITRNHSDAARAASALELEGIPQVIQRTGSVFDDAGIDRMMALAEFVANPDEVYRAMHLLLRPPLSMVLEDVQRIVRLHRERVSRETSEGGSGAAPTFVDTLRSLEDTPAPITRLLEWRDEAAALNAAQDVGVTMQRIATMIDAVHADLPSARERAGRLASVIEFLRYVQERVERLRAPRDIRAFLEYCEDLNDADRRPRAMSESRLGPGDEFGDDGDESARGSGGERAQGGVRVLTAHRAKGLEFHTVFVPRVSPGSGYPTTRSSDSSTALPETLVDRLGDDRSAQERALAEERRVFYVAATRAQQRLVLLARKAKSLSSSTHFFQEVEHDEAVKRDIAVLSDQDVYAAAAQHDVGSASARWREIAGGEVDSALGASRATTRLQVFERAAREARARAAMALDRAELGPSGHISEADGDGPTHCLPDASAAAASAALTLGALGELRRTGKAPVWLNDAPADVRAAIAAVQDALAQTEAGRSETGGACGAASVSAWAELVRANTPRGPLHLSYTHISAYLNCPRCYFAKYVLKLPEAASESANLGTIVHDALREFNRRLRDAEGEGAPPPGLNDLLRIGDMKLTSATDGGVDEDTRETIRQQFRNALALHEPEANILEVEKPIEIPFDKHRLHIRVDRIDELTTHDGRSVLRVIDYKTGAATKTKLQPDRKDLQLCVYAMGVGTLFPDVAEAGRAEYWVLSTGQRGVLEFANMRKDAAERQIRDTIEGILTGKFERSASDRYTHMCDLLDGLGV